jgi:hypothetical protein
MTRLCSKLRRQVIQWPSEGNDTTEAEEIHALQEIPITYLACDSCGADRTKYPSPLPYFCRDCYNSLQKRGYQDPTEDLALLHYLYTGQHKPGTTLAEQQRVRREAKVYELRTDTTTGRRDALFAWVNGVWKVVPPLGERRKLCR